VLEKTAAGDKSVLSKTERQWVFQNSERTTMISIVAFTGLPDKRERERERERERGKVQLLNTE
jgi:hypothetical protein